MSDAATTPASAPLNGAAIRHFLCAVHDALCLPAPRRTRDRLRYLNLLEQRARIARESIARLIGDSDRDALDYASEGDHILHLLAELLPDTYRHEH